MATLKEVKKRVGSAQTVHKLTRAMKLVSASKARAAQVANQASNPYSEKIYSLVKNLWLITNPKVHPLLSPNPSPRHCFVVIATDKGLCGSLIDNLEDFLVQEMAFSADNQFIIIGKRGSQIMLKHGISPTAIFDLGLRKPTFDFVTPIVRLITRGYLDNQFGDVTIIYTTYINSFKQVPGKRVILPALTVLNKASGKDTALYEPNADAVLESLLPRYLEIQLYQLILESSSSEHTARMMAMDKAANNAQEIISELTLVFNKVRQEKITQQLLEITTTVSALGNR